MELPKTIEDTDEVPNFSESSEDEMDVQPEKRKASGVATASKADFDSGFEFFSGTGGAGDYMNDEWSDISKYLKKKKPKTSLDERIERVRKERNKQKKSDVKT